MDGRKVLAILGIMAFVWPGALILVLMPFLGIAHLLGLAGSHADFGVGLVGLLICVPVATLISVRVYKRAFQEP